MEKTKKEAEQDIRLDIVEEKYHNLKEEIDEVKRLFYTHKNYYHPETAGDRGVE